jgi:hypothetical protein
MYAPDCNTKLNDLLDMLERFCEWRFETSSDNPSLYPEFDREWDRSLSLTTMEEWHEDHAHRLG